MIETSAYSRALRLLRFYSPDDYKAVCDVLTDLRHFCQERRIDFGDAYDESAIQQVNEITGSKRKLEESTW